MTPGIRVPTLLLAALLLLHLPAGSPAWGAGRGEPGPFHLARVELVDEEADLRQLHELGIDVDGVFRGWARLYLIEEELEKLRFLGYEITLLPDDGPERAAEARAAAESGLAGKPPAYHTYATLTADLIQVAEDHPDLTELTSLGQSVQGRELWILKITDNPGVEEMEPEVLYVGGIHGDEVVGKEMCWELVELLTDSYGTDPRITDLVDSTEIWILPSMNPDGTALGRRYNANFVDLNRDFPDEFVDPVNTPEGREVETGLVMLWAADHVTTLSGTFHGGALVVNYPRDGNPAGSSVYSASADDSILLSLARTYADANPPLSQSNGHPAWNNGVTNGADWYAINGGKQDWHYVWRGDFDMTLEISEIKWPDASTLPGFWDDNRESMLAYLERVHEGAQGVITDAQSGLPLAAEVRVAGNAYPAHTDPVLGDYHRVLLPGAYDLEYSATGYSTTLLQGVTVEAGAVTRRDVALRPLAPTLRPLSGCRVAGPDCEPWLEAGAAADLAVTARSLGEALSGVSARIEPTGWYAVPTRPVAAYPDLAPGESGESLAPHHGLTLSSEVPPGHKLGFALRWESAEGRGLSAPFFLPVGDPLCTTLDATGLPLAILDRQTTESSLIFPDLLETYDLKVGVEIRHTYISELQVDLISPAGTKVALHTRSGGSADDIVGTYGEDLTPFEPFSRMLKEASDGTWTLRVNDGVPGDQGTLVAWSLELCGRPLETSTPEMRFRSLRREGSEVRLSWWPYPGLDSYRVYRSATPSPVGAFTDVTSEDPDPTDSVFLDSSPQSPLYWLVTGVGPLGEGPKGH
jgi:carboxypeptidase D